MQTTELGIENSVDQIVPQIIIFLLASIVYLSEQKYFMDPFIDYCKKIYTIALLEEIVFVDFQKKPNRKGN